MYSAELQHSLQLLEASAIATTLVRIWLRKNLWIFASSAQLPYGAWYCIIFIWCYFTAANVAFLQIAFHEMENKIFPRCKRSLLIWLLINYLKVLNNTHLIDGSCWRTCVDTLTHITIVGLITSLAWCARGPNMSIALRPLTGYW